MVSETSEAPQKETVKGVARLFLRPVCAKASATSQTGKAILAVGVLAVIKIEAV